jgi:Skp family chaperone for outer membrane proteins
VKTLLSDPAVLRRHYEQGHGDPAVDVRAEQERARLERKLTALDREVTRLIDAYQAEVIELAELAERRHRIEDHGRMLRERVQEIEQQRADRATELRLLEGVDAFCASVQGAMEEPAFDVQQKVVQFVVNRMVVEDSRVIIEHVVPTGPVRLQPEHHPPQKGIFQGDTISTSSGVIETRQCWNDHIYLKFQWLNLHGHEHVNRQHVNRRSLDSKRVHAETIGFLCLISGLVLRFSRNLKNS